MRFWSFASLLASIFFSFFFFFFVLLVVLSSLWDFHSPHQELNLAPSSESMES